MSNTIIRAPRRYRFVTINQDAVEDSRLSWAARGLLGYLLSRPDDWKVLIKDLQRRGDLGRDGIYRLLKELRETGYVRYERTRDEQGRMRGGIYYVHEIPDSPHPGSPDMAQSDKAAPCPVKPEALPNTDKDLSRTTTTIPTDTYGGSRREFDHAGVLFSRWLPDELRAPATRQVAELSRPLAQMVIDEWTGAIAAGAIRSSPLGYLRALVQRMQQGEFTPKYAEQITQARKAGAVPL
ncbi:MAG: hypothetical protein R3F50_16530 [Gammaproteobacteria bacterium]